MGHTNEAKQECGSCFICGSLQHEIKDCPKNRTGKTHYSTHVKKTSLPNSFVVSKDQKNELCKYFSIGFIDSGSPTCIMKHSYVPKNYCLTF